MLAAGLAAGMFGYLTSFIVARFRHLALIMITLGIGLVLQEAANSASWLTGGSDGLQGIHTWPIFGTFHFDLVRLHRLQLRARRPVPDFPGCAAAHSFAVRTGAARHPRERRSACRRSARRRTRISAPSIPSPPSSPGLPAPCWRKPPKPFRSKSLGFQRSADVVGHAYPRRHRPALWRPRRRRRLHGRARPVLRPQSAILVFLDRPSA